MCIFIYAIVLIQRYKFVIFIIASTIDRLDWKHFVFVLFFVTISKHHEQHKNNTRNKKKTNILNKNKQHTSAGCSFMKLKKGKCSNLWNYRQDNFLCQIIVESILYICIWKLNKDARNPHLWDKNIEKSDVTWLLVFLEHKTNEYLALSLTALLISKILICIILCYFVSIILWIKLRIYTEKSCEIFKSVVSVPNICEMYIFKKNCFCILERSCWFFIKLYF